MTQKVKDGILLALMQQDPIPFHAFVIYQPPKIYNRNDIGPCILLLTLLRMWH